MSGKNIEVRVPYEFFRTLQIKVSWDGLARCGKTNHSLIFVWIELNVFRGVEDAQEDYRPQLWNLG
jgi:hypothetical protein